MNIKKFFFLSYLIISSLIVPLKAIGNEILIGLTGISLGWNAYLTFNKANQNDVKNKVDKNAIPSKQDLLKTFINDKQIIEEIFNYYKSTFEQKAFERIGNDAEVKAKLHDIVKNHLKNNQLFKTYLDTSVHKALEDLKKDPHLRLKLLQGLGNIGHSIHTLEEQAQARERNESALRTELKALRADTNTETKLLRTDINALQEYVTQQVKENHIKTTRSSQDGIQCSEKKIMELITRELDGLHGFYNMLQLRMDGLNKEFEDIKKLPKTIINIDPDALNQQNSSFEKQFSILNKEINDLKNQINSSHETLIDYKTKFAAIAKNNELQNTNFLDLKKNFKQEITDLKNFSIKEIDHLKNTAINPDVLIQQMNAVVDEKLNKISLEVPSALLCDICRARLSECNGCKKNESDNQSCKKAPPLEKAKVIEAAKENPKNMFERK